MTYKEITQRLRVLRDELTELDKIPTASLSEANRARLREISRETERLVERKRELEHQADLLAARAADIEPRLAHADGTPRITGTEPGDGSVPLDAPNINRLGGNPWGDRDQRAARPLRTVTAGGEARGRAISALERTALATADAERVASMFDDADGFEAAMTAEFVLAQSDPRYRSAFRKILVGRGQGHLEFDDAERAAFKHVRAVQRALTIGGTGSADLLVPMELDPQANLTSAGSVDPVRELATVRQTRTDTLHLVNTAGVTAHWRPEAEEMEDDSPSFSQPTVDVVRADAFIRYSWEAAQDAIDLEDQLRTLLRDAKAEHEAPAWITGSSVGEPEGLVTALSGSAQEVPTGSVGTFVVDDVYTVLQAIPPRFRAGSSVLAALPTIHTMRRFQTADEPSVVNDAGTSLLGRPLREASYLDPGTVGTGDDLLIAGNFRRGYVIADRLGATITVIDVLFGTTANYPTGESGMVLFWRTGGAVVLPEALRLLTVA